MEETNEQYFDRLAKGTGRETTPGFREWILDSMEELGERPSDAEISMMHLAYQAGADTARAEVEKLRERAAADVAKLYAERDESDRVGYARLQEIERLRAENRDLDNLQRELHDVYQKVSDWNKELRSLVAECRPVVELVGALQARHAKQEDHINEVMALIEAKLPAMEGGE